MNRNGLDDYHDVLRQMRRGKTMKKLPFLAALPAIESLHRTMVAVAPAAPGAADEEWNPLSQRPHAPLPPAVGDELGSEISAKKEAIDAFTTLCHEMLHVALWEPFFAGLWRPRGEAEFRAFSLLGEGYCFFFSDIILTGTVRERLADGEYALERQTPSSALFAPVRAFRAMGMKDPRRILDVYLDAFTGKKTKLWQPKGPNDYAAALAARTYDFYAQSLGYLCDLYGALAAFGVFDEFHARFCAVPGLATFANAAPGKDLKAYFAGFHGAGIAALARLSPRDARAIRARRLAQMRAYFVMQVRHLLVERKCLGRCDRSVLRSVDCYLDALEAHLRAGEPEVRLHKLDVQYEATVRQSLIRGDVWAGERALVLPKRAGGRIGIFDAAEPGRAGRVRRLVLVAYLIDELNRRMKASRTVEDRTAVVAEIARVARAAAAKGSLAPLLKRPLVREAWSLPLAAVDPAGNSFRELVFSYQ